MKLQFTKYEGAGNDFVIIDDRKACIDLSKGDISKMCDRRFGIGADGLLLLEHSDVADYQMRYFNSDGGEARMCGNGGRCIAMFAFDMGIAGTQQIFEAADGIHKGDILAHGKVSLMMTGASVITKSGDGYLLDTGVAHYVEQGKFDIERARELRHKLNANVNFIENTEEGLRIRTFERGVEGETLSCGTGAVAAALVWSVLQNTPLTSPIVVKALGGDLEVSQDAQGNIWLTGSANRVFEGVIDLK